MDEGGLVPDEVVIGLVKERLTQPDTENGFILDGFPRTLPQAEALDAALAEVGKSIDVALAVVVDPEVIVGRLTARRTCTACGKITTVSALVDGACPYCGGEVYQRDDDNEATVRNRLNVYAESTAPLIGYYGGKGVLVEVDGDRPVDEVWADVEERTGEDRGVIVRKSSGARDHARGRAGFARALRLGGEPGPVSRPRSSTSCRGGHPRRGRRSRVQGVPRFPEDPVHVAQRAGRTRHPVGRSSSPRATSSRWTWARSSTATTATTPRPTRWVASPTRRRG